MVRAGLWVASAVAWSVGGTRLPPAGVPVALAWLVTEPASRSAWVTVWTAVQVVVSAGAEGGGEADGRVVGVVVADGDGR